MRKYSPQKDKFIYIRNCNQDGKKMVKKWSGQEGGQLNVAKETKRIMAVIECKQSST